MNNWPVALDFRFKGSRTYVHGTDIYSTLVEELGKAGFSGPAEFQLSFKGLMRHNLVLTEFVPDGKRASAVFSLLYPDGTLVKGGLVEAETIPVERYPYDEERVVNGWEFDSERSSARLTVDGSEYSVIEMLVALNKALLNRIHKPSGKWLFARLKLHELLPKSASSLRLESGRTGNLRLVRSSISIDCKPYGSIFFSLT